MEFLGAVVWYQLLFFAAIASPSSGPPFWVSAIGSLGLIAGIASAIIHQRPQLLWFAVPASASHLVFLVYWLLADVRQPASAAILLGYAATEFILIGGAAWMAREHKFGATALSVFCLCYALYAAFYGQLALNGAYI